MNDVIKVESNRLSSSNGIWWNSLAASSFKKIIEPLNLGDISSKFGGMKRSLFTAEYNFFWSMHTLTSPFCFLTGTMGEHIIASWLLKPKSFG